MEFFLQCDVSKADKVKMLIDKIISVYGRLDFAFNKAGIEGNIASIHECTEDNWGKTIGINLKGIRLCMKYEIVQMLKQGNESVVNCASVGGLSGFASLCGKQTWNSWINQNRALENAKSGIRINAVCLVLFALQ